MPETLRVLLHHQVFRFLIVGGLAAAINWGVRFPLSLYLTLTWAILVAYMIGMTAGFLLYRRYVFAGPSRSLAEQIIAFTGVNLVSALLVLWLTQVLIPQMPAGFSLDVREGLSHAIAIACGAVANFFGHKILTFRKHRPLETAPKS